MDDAKYENCLNENLDKYWRQKAETELGEKDDEKNENIKKLYAIIVADENIPVARRDDSFLLRFLRAKKFDVDKAFRMMQKYLKMKQECVDLFRVSPIEQMDDLLKMQIQQTLCDRDPNGCLIYLYRVKNCDPYKCSVEKVFRSNILSLENAVRDPRTQISGLTIIVDMAGVSFAYAKFLSPHFAKKTVEVVQECFPLRFKAFHILNQPFYFDAVLTILRPFLKEKIRNRIITHGNNLSSLHRHIPKNILPKEYGGELEAFDNTKWREQIIDDKDYFQRLESYVINKQKT